MPNFGTNNALSGYFWAGILKNYCHIWNQRAGFCLITKVCAKIKLLQFGTKNTLEENSTIDWENS